MAYYKQTILIYCILIILIVMLGCLGKSDINSIPIKADIELLISYNDPPYFRFFKITKNEEEIRNIMITGSPFTQRASAQNTSKTFKISEGNVSKENFSTLWKDISLLTSLKSKIFDWRYDSSSQGPGTLIISYDDKSKQKTVKCEFKSFPTEVINYKLMPKFIAGWYEFLYRKEISRTESILNILNKIVNSNSREEGISEAKNKLVYYIGNIYKSNKFPKFKKLLELSLSKIK